MLICRAKLIDVSLALGWYSWNWGYGTWPLFKLGFIMEVTMIWETKVCRTLVLWWHVWQCTANWHSRLLKARCTMYTAVIVTGCTSPWTLRTAAAAHLILSDNCFDCLSVEPFATTCAALCCSGGSCKGRSVGTRMRLLALLNEHKVAIVELCNLYD